MLSHQVNFTNWHATDLEPAGYRPEPISYHSTVLELVKSSCKRMKSPTILQAGRLGQGFMEFVTETHGRLVTFEPETDDGRILLNYLKEGERKFDAIFLWDRLLYNDINDRRELLKLVDTCSGMGTSLVIYSSTRRAMPVRPSKFALVADSGIEMIPTTTITTEMDQFDINKQLPNWRCMRATQLRNGFREHLLVKRS